MIDIRENFNPQLIETKKPKPPKVDLFRTLGLLTDCETAEGIHWKNFSINSRSGRLNPTRSIIIAKTDGTGTPIRLEHGQWRVIMVDIDKIARTILSTKSGQTFRFYEGCNISVYLVKQLTE